MPEAPAREPRPNDIAIIGMAGRFPHARDLRAFWQNLTDGRDCATRFTDEELAAAGVPEALRRHPQYVPVRAILEGAEGFDHGLFGLSPMEASQTDPQQRIMLEVAREALEDAGIDPARAEGKLIGVYAGADESFAVAARLAAHASDMGVLIGNNRDYLATRVAFELDLKGPAITLQTACSTSLVAVQVACQALLGWQCDVALAGGAGLSFPQRAGYLYQPGGILSPDGKTRSFDAEGRGTIGGDGCGLVVLKRLAEAIADGDCVRAVIRGAAINNDGAGKVGFMAPSLEGQSEVIAMALAAAEVEAGSVGYVEAHGTATELGDPIEWQALDEVYKGQTERRQFCAIGSVKSNVGHLNSASGIAGLLKAALCLQHRQIPPSLHWSRPNPRIDMADSCFVVNDRLRPWASDGPRRAGVSSFGVGGTNAHAVLEEYIEAEYIATEHSETEPDRASAWPLLVTGRTATALEGNSQRLQDHLAANPDLDVRDVAWTLLTGRQHFRAHQRLRMAASAAGAAGLTEQAATRARSGTAHLTMLFPGQGILLAGAGRGWYRLPEARAALDACAGILRTEGVDLLGLLCGAGGEDQASPTAEPATEVVQPALFSLCYAIARQWEAWGARADALLGHSVGEYVAAAMAGVFTLEGALRLVAARGRLMGGLPAGAMLAVEVSGEEAERRIAAGELAGASVAVYAAPGRCVLAGPIPAIREAEARLEREGVACKALQTSHAFHCAMMDPILGAFEARARATELRPPERPFLSCLTGGWITPEQATDPGYWARQLRAPVRLEAMIGLAAAEGGIWLEAAPARSLGGAVRRCRAGAEVLAPGAGGEDCAPILKVAAQLYQHGLPVAWRAVFGAMTDRAPRRVPLPTYAFDHVAFPVDLPDLRASAQAGPEGHQARRPIERCLYLPGWRQERWPAAGRLSGPILALLPEEGGPGAATAAALVGELRAAGHRVSVARPGAPGADRGEVRVQPGEAGQVAALVAGLMAQPEPPEMILHLWGLGAAGSGPGSFQRGLDRGLYSLLQLARGLGDRAVRLRVICSQAVDVLGGEAVSGARAAMAAAAQGIAQELPGVDVRLIDLLDGGEAEPAQRAAWLAGLIGAEAAPEARLVAIRGQRLWVPELRAVAPPGEAEAEAALSAGAGQQGRPICLITGGTGAIGLAMAEALAGRGWDLALLSRRGELSAAGAARVRAMEAAGAAVRLVRADVADAAQVGAALAELRRAGRIAGVIHAAGAAGWGAVRPIAQTDAAFVEEQRRARLEGLIVLDRLLTEGLRLRIFAGSLSGVIGGAGLAGYAASFRMVGAAVAGSRWGVIHWDGWAEGPGAPGITAEEGGRVLGWAAAMDEPELAVSLVDPALRLRERAPIRARRVSQPRPSLESAHVAPAEGTERQIAAIWEEVLGIEGLGAQDDFFALGGDSLMALQIRGRLREQFGVDLSPEELLGSPTVAAVAARVDRARLAGSGLAGQGAAQGAPKPSAPVQAPAAPLPAPRQVTAEGPPEQEDIARFYDSVTRQLDQGPAGDYALFLNYGYVALPREGGGTDAEAAVAIPAATLDRNSVQLVLELLGPIRPGAAEDWLDVGCGRGGTVRTIRTFFAPGSLTGLDLSPEAVASCTRRLGDARTRFVCGDAQRLPFGDGAFDGVTNVESSHNYRDAAAFYGEVARVLRPGGWFAYTDLIVAEDWPRRERLLAEAGLEIQARRDITANVLRSLSETAARKARAYRGDNDGALLDDFLGTPTSAPFRGMQGGTMRYMLYRLRRR